MLLHHPWGKEFFNNYESSVKKKTPITKLEARRTVAGRRKETPASEIMEKSLRIKERLSNCDDFVYADNIFMYLSTIKGDIESNKILELAMGWGKSVVLPKIHEHTKTVRRFPFISYNDLVLNKDGFLEPKIGIEEDLSDIDLIIVPSIAVSMLGQRVGIGRGFYDNLLKKAYAPKYVLAFEFQLFNEIESERHDVRIDKIITERRIIDTRSR